MIIENNKVTNKIVGKWLREKRLDCRYTLAEVGNKLGHQRSWLGDIESGRNTTSFINVLNLCEIYGCDVNELLMVLKINEVFKMENKND